MTDLTVPTIHIADIRIGKRHRYDLGDIAELAASIAINGLLHPIVIRPDNTLVAGERRLEAVRRLGWTQVPVTYIEGIESLTDLLTAERDENTCRKDMTPVEKIALGTALEGLYRAGKLDKDPVLDTSRKESKELAAIVARAVGVERSQYYMAKRILNLCESPNPVLAKAAQRARDEMENTGRIYPPYRKLLRVLNDAETASATTVEHVFAPKEHRKRNYGKGINRSHEAAVERRRRIKDLAGRGWASVGIAKELGISPEGVRKIARDEGVDIAADRVLGGSRKFFTTDQLLDEVCDTLSNLEPVISLVDLNEVDPERLPEWREALTAHIGTLTQLRNQVVARVRESK